MRNKKIVYSLLALLGAVLLLLFVFFFIREQREVKRHKDFGEIKREGKLTILTLSESTSYFVYKDSPMGYHYDMANAFCEANDLELEVKTGKNINQLLRMLSDGEGDLIAYPLPLQNELKDSILYCGLSLVSHQVLVQRSNRDSLVNDVPELIGKEITVQRNSKYHQRLENLNAEVGGGIQVNTAIGDSLTTEDLIEMVSKKLIAYTVCDEYVAKLNRTFYRNINIKLPVSFDQRSSWAVSKDTPQLAKKLNEWYAENEKKPIYAAISKKYFELSKLPPPDEYNLQSLPPGQVSPYDELFKKHAQNSHFQWQLLAAISFHESRFINGKSSWAGAAGIMGLMPRTAKIYGISSDERMNPDASIGVAVKLLKKLDQLFKDVEDPAERMKFVLAAYNGGIGHITDIRALAEKYGDNKYIWEGHVRNWMTKKRDPQYYNDPVCKSGYFRGSETLKYVDNVLRTIEVFKARPEKMTTSPS